MAYWKKAMLVQTGENIEIYAFNREHNMFSAWPVKLPFNLKLVTVMVNFSRICKADICNIIHVALCSGFIIV